MHTNISLVSNFSYSCLIFLQFIIVRIAFFYKKKSRKMILTSAEEENIPNKEPFKYTKLVYYFNITSI